MSRAIQKREKFSRIKELRCFDQVHEMLAHGCPAPSVANFIRDQGEYDDVTIETLINALKKYRLEILPADVISNRFPHIIIEAKKAYTDKLEELRRLDNQYEALLYRFDLAHSRERASGFIDPQVDKIQKSIGDCIRMMHIIKMDLGISGQQHVGSMHVSPERLEEIRAKYGDMAARAMANPVSRSRVLAALDLIRKEHYLKAKEAGEIIEADFTVEDKK